MFDLDWIGDLDGDGAADALVEAHAGLLEAEARQLLLAAHWADLHNGDAVDTSGRALPGMERARRLGGPGTPTVGEFAAAEFGALQGIGYIAASRFLADALDLRHRHPRLWAAVFAGKVRVWQARHVARVVREAGLGLDEARAVDAATTLWVGSQTWSGFLDTVAAAVIAADPETAEKRRLAAELDRFVRTGQSNAYGLKTLVARATAGEVIFFTAMCDRIATILCLAGDDSPADVRRSKALGILADPARALAMLQEYAGHGLNDTPTPPPSEDDHQVDPDNDPAPDPSPRSPETPGTPAAFVKPMRVDPAKLRPAATLYVHLSQDAFGAALAGEAAGVARLEGVGPITLAQAREFLAHCNVTVTPVLDVAGQAPVDGYEVPDRMREAITLRHPREVFPHGPRRSRGADLDHADPYREHGPPGQTDPANLGPLSRHAHRLKTHGGWQVRQPFPGIYLWRSPHGYHFLVDHTGTQPLGRARRLSPTLPEQALYIDYAS